MLALLHGLPSMKLLGLLPRLAASTVRALLPTLQLWVSRCRAFLAGSDLFSTTISLSFAENKKNELVCMNACAHFPNFFVSLGRFPSFRRGSVCSGVEI